MPGEGSDDEPEIELDDDPAHCTTLDVSRVPVTISVSQVCEGRVEGSAVNGLR